jgi:hypothetical protein
LLHDISCVMPDLVLLLFHFQFLLSSLHLTAIGIIFTTTTTTTTDFLYLHVIILLHCFLSF